jgi:hypothetical protein
MVDTPARSVGDEVTKFTLLQATRVAVGGVRLRNNFSSHPRGGSGRRGRAAPPELGGGPLDCAGTTALWLHRVETFCVELADYGEGKAGACPRSPNGGHARPIRRRRGNESHLFAGNRTFLTSAPTGESGHCPRCQAADSLSSRGGRRGLGRGGGRRAKAPLSPALSPLVPRRAREKSRAVPRYGRLPLIGLVLTGC